MGQRVFLIHWNAEEAEAYAADLRADGWHVDWETEDGARAFQRIKADPPDLVVIHLSRLPSHGRETARALRKTKATCKLPIIFVDGAEEAIEKVKAVVPDGLFLPPKRARNVLAAFASSSASADVTLNYHITLREYDPNWPTYYEEEKARLLDVISKWVEEIQHVGSTSIPGLRAKAIVDLMVGVADLERGGACIEPLQTLGYIYRDDLANLMPDRLFFERGTDTDLRYHVLIVEHKGNYWERYSLFRDYLRTHPDEARRYEKLKRHLAEEHPNERHEYSEAKTEFVSEIVAKARAAGSGGT